jgi:methylmalonyl-CoA/ethylmalonyl-CoA epimerase
MLEEFSFHHVGIAVKSIENTAAQYTAAGWSLTGTVHDPIQGVRIAFLERSGFPRLELVAGAGEASPVNNILKKNGVAPYHFCYETADLEAAIAELERREYRALGSPVPAVAFGGRRICFLWHADTGLIELLQRQAADAV